jgi:hypothetical protein
MVKNLTLFTTWPPTCPVCHHPFCPGVTSNTPRLPLPLLSRSDLQHAPPRLPPPLLSRSDLQHALSATTPSVQEWPPTRPICYHPFCPGVTSNTPHLPSPLLPRSDLQHAPSATTPSAQEWPPTRPALSATTPSVQEWPPTRPRLLRNSSFLQGSLERIWMMGFNNCIAPFCHVPSPYSETLMFATDFHPEEDNKTDMTSVLSSKWSWHQRQVNPEQFSISSILSTYQT